MTAARGRGGSHFQLQHEEQAEKEQHPTRDAVHVLHSTFDAKLASADVSDIGGKRSRQQQKLSDHADLLAQERQPLDHRTNAEDGRKGGRKVSRTEEPLAHQDCLSSEVSRFGFEVPAVSQPRERRPFALQPLVANESSCGEPESDGGSTSGDYIEALATITAASVPDATAAATSWLPSTAAARVRTGRAWKQRLHGEKASPCQGGTRGILSYSLNRCMCRDDRCLSVIYNVSFVRVQIW